MLSRHEICFWNNTSTLLILPMLPDQRLVAHVLSTIPRIRFAKGSGLSVILVFLFVNASCLHVHEPVSPRPRIHLHRSRNNEVRVPYHQVFHSDSTRSDQVVFLRLWGGEDETNEGLAYKDCSMPLSLNQSHAGDQQGNRSLITLREEDSTIFDDSDFEVPRRPCDPTRAASQEMGARPSFRHLSPRSLRVKRNLVSSVNQGRSRGGSSTTLMRLSRSRQPCSSSGLPGDRVGHQHLLP